MYKKFKLNSVLFVLLVIILILEIILYAGIKNSKTAYKVYNNFQNEIIKTNKNLEESLLLYINLEENNDSEISLLKLDENLNIVSWNNSYSSFNKYGFIYKAENNLIVLPNGFYLKYDSCINDTTYVALKKIKNSYEFENEYLENEFQNINFDKNIDIVFGKTKYPIYNNHGKYIFSIILPNEIGISKIKGNIYSILWIIFLILISIVLYQYFFRFCKFKNLSFRLYSFIISILLLKLSSYFIIKNSILIYCELFSPTQFAYSQIFPSLGDTLISIWLIFILVIGIYSYDNKNIKTNKYIRIIIDFLKINLIYLLFFFNVLFIKIIVENSMFSLDFRKLLHLNIYSYISYIIFALLFASAILLCVKIINSFTSKKLYYIIINTISLLLWTVFAYLKYDFYYILEPFFTYVFILLLTISVSDNKLLFRFSSGAIIVSILALQLSINLTSNIQTREIQHRELLAVNLSDDKDPYTEYLFEVEHNEILNNEVLINRLNNYKYYNEEIIKMLNELHFNDYWDKYYKEIIICNNEDSLLVDGFLEPNCKEYFKNVVDDNGIETDFKNLYYINYKNGVNTYIGQIIVETDFDTINIFIEFIPKFVPKGLGYPELLSDEKFNVGVQIDGYSFAKYKNNELIEQFGDYQYNITNDFDFNKNENFTKIIKNNFLHLIYNIDSDSILIVSSPKNSFLDNLAAFAYIFILFGLTLLIIQIIFINKKFTNLQNLSFKSRVQFTIISISIMSLLFVGISTVLYISDLNDKKNMEALEHTTNSILVELEHKLSGMDTISENDFEYIENYLIKFSNVFFTDINLYSTKGELIATSRDMIFDYGLIGNKINYIALNEIMNNNKSIFIHNENIGKMNFHSAYVPIKNNNEIIAIANVPSYTTVDENKDKISEFLIPFINIFILIIVFSTLIAVIISNYISYPLKAIRENIKKFEYGGKNEKIKYYHKDEIGSLVHEYNNMIDELENSAKLLAKSERESAWREMARQVAHEIKNPLTPMKLSVQHLNRIVDDADKESLDNYIKRFTLTLVEQIDNLSTIANEFSNFAQMPEQKPELVNIIETINNSVLLYKDNQECSLNIDFNKNTICNVYIDKKQLIRVFNNIIKNAIQACDINKEHKYINIILYTKNGKCIIEFKDNGLGIEDSKKEKIFNPNFTTKTSGMGLGLAMVKSIIKSSNGDIYFESEEGIGTTFTIELPLV